MKLADEAGFTLNGKPPYTENNGHDLTPPPPAFAPPFGAHAALSAGKFACLVCRRQFATEEKLCQHVTLSDLHKTSLAQAKEEGKIQYLATKPKASPLASSGIGDDALAKLLGTSSKLEQQLKAAARPPRATCRGSQRGPGGRT